MFVNVFIVVYVQEMDAQSLIRSCIGCARQEFQNFAIFVAKDPLAPMTLKYLLQILNLHERLHSCTFILWTYVDVRLRLLQLLDVRVGMAKDRRTTS